MAKPYKSIILQFWRSGTRTSFTGIESVCWLGCCLFFFFWFLGATCIPGLMASAYSSLCFCHHGSYSDNDLPASVFWDPWGAIGTIQTLQDNLPISRPLLKHTCEVPLTMWNTVFPGSGRRIWISWGWGPYSACDTILWVRKLGFGEMKDLA
jgi:hypothetical protein